MNKLAVGMVLAALLGVASPAQATSFQFSYDVNLYPWKDNFGLNVWTNDHPDVESVTLNPGQSDTIGLFYVGTDEDSVDLDDWIPYLASVTFNFSNPDYVDGQVLGLTGGGYYGYREGEKGYIGWDNPLSVSFGSNGTLLISLSKATFDVPTEQPGSIVWATFKLVGGSTPPASVPEPSSLALLGVGLGAVVARARRKVAA
jgi:hypothetical protein